MKKYLSLFLAAIATMSLYGADYSAYYQNLPVELSQVADFEIPNRSVNLSEFGGVADGVTLNSEAFKSAIEALSNAGGGRLVVSEGVWLTGPIELKSNIELHLERNAVVYFSPDKSLYVDPKPKASRALPCISAIRCKNIAITGEGTIDGNGAQWRPVKRDKVSTEEWKAFLAMGGVERKNGTLWYPWELKSGYPDIKETPEKQEKLRTDLVRINYCENIRITGVTFQNAPKFHVHPSNCVNVIIDGITVRCPWNAQNGDAIDLSDCHRALVVNSVVDCGDDGICMKSDERSKSSDVWGCEDILIQDNIVYHGHGGFVIGSESICGMKRIIVRDCTFSGTDIGLRFKSNPGRGGKCEDIYISDIMMTDIKDEAISLRCDYLDKPAGYTEGDNAIAEYTNVPEFTDIHISNVVCRGAETAIEAIGVADLRCIYGVTISNSTIVYTKNSDNIDAATAEIKLENVNLVKDKKL